MIVVSIPIPTSLFFSLLNYLLWFFAAALLHDLQNGSFFEFYIFATSNLSSFLKEGKIKYKKP